MKLKFNKEKINKILRYIFLAGYITCFITLVVESSMNGEVSATQSNSLGNKIADLIEGDDKDPDPINPTSITINNKINEAYVGEEYTLNTLIYPDNSTYKGINYDISNKELATINSDGKISFLKEGDITITASSSFDSSIYDEMDVTIKNVIGTSLDVSLSIYENNKFSNIKEDKNNYYTLYSNKNYQINSVIQPENTTITTIDYSPIKNEYFSIKNNTLTTLKSSDDYISLNIESKYNNLIRTIYLKIVEDETNFVPFESIKFVNEAKLSLITSCSYSLKTNNFSYIINNNSSIPTYSEVDFLSGDTTIINIKNNMIYALKEGNVTLTCRSVKYNNIYCTKDIEVKNQSLKSMSITIDGVKNKNSLYINTTKTFLVSFSPTIFTHYSKNDDTLAFTSSNEDVVKIIDKQKGKIQVVGLGESIITATIKNIEGFDDVTATYTIEGMEKKSSITGYDLNIKTIEKSVDNQQYLLTNKTYNLSNYISIVTFEGDIDEKENIPKKLSFKIIKLYNQLNNEIEEENYDQYFSLTNTNLFVKQNCSFLLKTIHDETKIEYTSSLLKFIVYSNPLLVNSYDINKQNTYVNPTSFKVDKTYQLDFNVPINYIISSTSTPISRLNLINDNKSIQITSDDIDNFDLIILSDTNLPEELGTTINIQFSYVLLTGFKLNIFDDLKNKIEIANNKIDLINKNSYDFTIELDNIPTKSLLNIYSLNDDILEVKNEKLIVKDIGNTSLIIEDSVSKVIETYEIRCINLIKLKENEEYTISGNSKYYEIDNEGKITILKGYSIKINPNFINDSTYKIANYSSSNKDVVDVSSDGVITPINSGSALINIKIDDGFSNKIEKEIQIEVKSLNTIQNIDRFLFLVRKSLGHFGAFFILGIFSSLFFLLTFKGEKRIFSIPINFIQGFTIASLTELIQCYVIGRSGLVKDVGIDMFGFLISSIAITIIILAIYFIKKYKEIHKKFK